MSALANPWILARLALGVAASLLAVVASVGAWRVFAHYRADAPPDTRTLALERQSELVSTMLGAAFVMELLAVLFTVLAADRLAGSLRGAMCAFGVVHANGWGPRALGTAALASAGASAWLGVRRVDARLRRGSLVRVLAGGALCVSALVLADLYAAWRFFSGLDMEIAASCCSVFVDRNAGGDAGIAASGPLVRTLWQGGAAMGVAMVLTAVTALRARGVWSTLAGVSGLGASAFAWRVLSDVMAPYVFETPTHRCPYCLLHSEQSWAGPVALAGLATAALCSAAMVSVAWVGRRAGARGASESEARSLARGALFGWGMCVAAIAASVLAYRYATGTFSLFG